jgi:hypothetical protein
MAITNSSDRQYPLVAVIGFDYTDFTSGEALAVAQIPADAVVVGGMLVFSTLFNSATSDTFTVGDGVDDDEYAAGVNAKTTAYTALVPTGYQYTANTDLVLKWTGVGTAPTQGAGFLIVQYVREGRANENHG